MLTASDQGVWLSTVRIFLDVFSYELYEIKTLNLFYKWGSQDLEVK